MFGSPELILFDSMRVVAALAALVIIGATPFAVARPRMSWGQRLRFIGLAAVCTAIVGSYLEALGTIPPAWWRTVLITLGALLSLAGVLTFLRDDSHPTRGRHG